MALVVSCRIGLAAVLLSLALVGCRSAGGTGPPDGITSSIVSGKRKMTQFGIAHDVDVQVKVVGRGAAFGKLQVSDLFLTGSMPRDIDSWTVSDAGGRPQRYEVAAIYNPSGPTTAQVIVTVTVQDLVYSGSDRTVYSARHPIAWDRVEQPAP